MPRTVTQIFSSLGRYYGEPGAVYVEIRADALRAAWRRIAASGVLAPTHDLVEVTFQKKLFGGASTEGARRPAWQPERSSPYCLDADGLVLEKIQSGAIPGRTSGRSIFAVAPGEPCRPFPQTVRRASGPAYRWSVADGFETHEPDLDAQHKLLESPVRELCEGLIAPRGLD